jgi:hypothetical protein
MGCNFAAGASTQTPDPEKTILEALDAFWVDKKIFTMLIGLLVHRLYALINTQRLLILSKNLPEPKLALLAILSHKVARHTGDKRFLELYKKLKHTRGKLIDCPKQYQDPFYIARKGADKDFKKMLVAVADFFEPQHEKKFKSMELILSENPWLRLRAIAGPEFRADAVYFKVIQGVDSQAEAVKLIGCNKSSVSRIWQSIDGLKSA